MSAPLWQNAEIIEIVEINENVKQFFLLPETPVEFEPGQMVVLELPINEKRNLRWRSYSIANVPNKKGVIELCISRQTDGVGSAYLFDEVAEGDSVKMKKPSGVFLRPKDAKHIVMVSTGTGVVPFRSMIIDWSRNPGEQSIHLIFGTRYGRGILFAGDFIGIEKETDKFSYDVVLSREETDEYYHGYVHAVYQDKYSDASDTVFMLCGWSAMINDAERILTEEMGVKPEQIIKELYD